MAAKINIDATRRALQEFRFGDVFIQELNWSNPTNARPVEQSVKEMRFTRKAIAELSGAIVFEVSLSDGSIPEKKQRDLIAKEVTKLHGEHVLIFIDGGRKQSIWHWTKMQDKKLVPREHFYLQGQPGDLFIAKLSALVFDISEFDEEGAVSIADVAARLKAALDVEAVTKKFFKDYQQQYVEFLTLIEGIENEADRRWYASVILNRLMFIYFLQKKLFLDGGREYYLTEKLADSKTEGSNRFYSHFLRALFFEGFAKQEGKRKSEVKKLIGDIKYLNGGLFLPHRLEGDERYGKTIKIPDKAFENLFRLFDRYSWSLNDTPGGKDDEINPDVLGYIFEKYINQKAFGAYYTRTEITEYLCEQTVYKLILDAVNGPEVDKQLLKAAKLEGADQRRYSTIAELLIHLDATICKKLIIGPNAVLSNLSLLDPACGSGAFLVAAMKTLINVYAAVIGKIEFLNDKALTKWLDEIKGAHPSVNYYIKKQIITANLYGVDIMEEATEIARLRLFLALVASAEKVSDLEPLPNIDFNIMAGNSLIGMMRVDSSRFDKHYGRPSAKGSKGKTLQNQNLFRPEVSMGNLFSSEHAKSYDKLIQDREANIAAYKKMEGADSDTLAALKRSIEESEGEARATLNELLLQEFNNLGIQYQQATWDAAKGKEAKPVKQPLRMADIEALEPFHWGYQFSEIFRKKNGFDAIITNPPWEIFKPNSKEFLMEFSDTVSKKKMDIKLFEKEQDKLLKDPEIQAAWLEYLSRFPHISLYYRGAIQYKNQISVVNGKKAGTDINLYKLFTEQCHNLLHKEGYCGIVIPSGIYTDLGSKQLRQLLFDESEVSALVSLSNEKFLFEEVHHGFKFTILSFKKGDQTDSFSATFRINPREAVRSNELDFFLHNADNFFTIPVSFIKRQSPDSLSVMEIRSSEVLRIIEKMLAFPQLSTEIKGSWQFRLRSEFHMTNDSYLFKTKPGVNRLPLYEGKMIHQFTHQYAEGKYWVEEKEGRKAILGNEPDKKQRLPYQSARLVHRALAASTNQRTMIATIVPPNVFLPHSINFCVIEGNDDVMLYLLGILNSYVLDSYLRLTVTTNLTMSFIYQLPVPRLKPTDRWYLPIVERAARLVCTTDEFAELWEEVMGNKWSEKKAAISDSERNKLRAELDGIIAHIYTLSEEEFAYLLATFPLVPQAQKVAAQNAYRDVAKSLIQ